MKKTKNTAFFNFSVKVKKLVGIGWIYSNFKNSTKVQKSLFRKHNAWSHKISFFHVFFLKIMHFENVQPDRVFLSSDTGGAFFFPNSGIKWVVELSPTKPTKSVVVELRTKNPPI